MVNSVEVESDSLAPLDCIGGDQTVNRGDPYQILEGRDDDAMARAGRRDDSRNSNAMSCGKGRSWILGGRLAQRRGPLQFNTYYLM